MTSQAAARASRRRSAPARCGPRLLEATVELPGRARLRAVRRRRWSPSGPGSAGAPSCTTSRPRTTWSSPPSSTSPRCAAPSCAAAARRCRPGRGAPARCCGCSPTTSPSPVFTAALELWVAARTDEALLRGGRAARAAGRPRDPPADRRAARRRRVAARRARAGAGHPRPGPRPRPGQHDHRRRRAPRAGSSTSGPTPSTTALEEPRDEPMPPRRAVLDRPQAEGDQLDAARRRPRRAEGWRTPTPAAGWDVATQVAHLAWTDEVAVARRHRQGGVGRASCSRRIGDPDGLRRREALAGGAGAARGAPRPLARRARPLGRGAAGLPRRRRRCRGSARRCRPTSMATARFMETWAHALDVYDGARRRARAHRPDPARRPPRRPHPQLLLRRRTGSTPPAEEFRVELTAPSRRAWAWGPDDAAQAVTGSAYDFCLLVTQRVHRADTDLVATGADADQLARHRPGVRRAARRGAGPRGDAVS